MLSRKPQHEFTPICCRGSDICLPQVCGGSLTRSSCLLSCHHELTVKLLQSFFPKFPFPHTMLTSPSQPPYWLEFGLEKFIYYFLYSRRDKIVRKANSECVRCFAFSQVTFHVSEQCKFPAYSILPGESFIICIRNPTPPPISSL